MSVINAKRCFLAFSGAPRSDVINVVLCLQAALNHCPARQSVLLSQNGYIKCKNNGKKTRQYSIDIKDLFTYIDTAETLCLPCGIFSSRHAVDPAFHLPPSEDFAQWLKNEWHSVNDLLRLDEVAVITGYALSAVQKWTYKKKLQCLWAQAKVLTTKEWLIKFFVNHGHCIIRKSDIHLRLLQKFYNQQ